MKQPSKISNVLKKAKECIETGCYYDTTHAKLRKSQRRVSLAHVFHIVQHGYHEKAKDQYHREHDDWTYSIRGKTVDEKDIRISRDEVSMKMKKVKRFVYEGLGFPVVLINVPLVKKRDIWTPAIDYNKLQKEVLVALSYKAIALTGNEVHFIRVYFEMTLESFGKHFGVTHVTVLTWERMGDKPGKISPTTELCIRLFILEKLKMSNQVFRDAFREFDIASITKEYKTPSLKIKRPLTLSGTNIAKRAYARN